MVALLGCDVSEKIGSAVLITSNCIFSQVFQNCKYFSHFFQATPKIVILGTGSSGSTIASLAPSPQVMPVLMGNSEKHPKITIKTACSLRK